MTVITKSGCPRFQENLDTLQNLIQRELKSTNPQITVNFISCDLMLGTENFPTWGDKYKCVRYNYQEYINGIYSFINSPKLAGKVKDYFPRWLKESFDVELNHSSHEELVPHPEKYALNYDENLPEEHQEIILLVTYEVNNFEDDSRSITLAFPNLLYDHVYTYAGGSDMQTKIEVPAQEAPKRVLTIAEVDALLGPTPEELHQQKTKEIELLQQKIAQLKDKMEMGELSNKDESEREELKYKILRLERKLESLKADHTFKLLDF